MKKGNSLGGWRSVVGVVAVGAFTLGVTALAAPNGRDDSASRGTTKGATEVTRLVTGDSAQINSVVAGTPPTAVLAINPVGAKVGSYPAGTTIVGNELISPDNGFRAWFEVQISNWDPNNDNNPLLGAYQVKVDASGYMDTPVVGNQDDLTPPDSIPCPGGDPSPCIAAFGDSWAECKVTEVCGAGYTDSTGTNREDSWCTPSAGGCNPSGVDTGALNYRWFGVNNAASRPDHDGRCVGGSRNGQSCQPGGPAVCLGGGACTGPKHPTFYGGTLVLDVLTSAAPTGPRGTYTVGLVVDETYIEDKSSPPLRIPVAPADIRGFKVTITTGSCCFGLGTPGAGCTDDLLARECNALPAPRVFTPGGLCSDGCVECTVQGVDPLCDDGDACTTETCDALAGVCIRGNKAGWTTAVQQSTICCNPSNGNLVSNDDGDPCTADDCSGDPTAGSPKPGNGVPRHTCVAGGSCDDENPCTTADTCACTPAAGTVPPNSTVCTGTDVNSIACGNPGNPPCPNDPDGNPRPCVAGFCFCTATPDLDIIVTNSPKSPQCEGGTQDGASCADDGDCPGGGVCNQFAEGGNCFAEGAKIMAVVRIGAAAAPINGGQFLLTYDPSCVDFNSIAPIAPYQKVYPATGQAVVNESAGTIFIAIGVDAFAGVDGPSGNANVLTLSFTKVGECNECCLGFDSNNPQNTYLVDDEGQRVGVSANDKCVRASGDLVLETPDNIKTNADCDGPTAVETWDSPSASFSCGDATLSCRGAHESGLAYSQSVVLNGGEFPQGSSSFCCSAVADDDCGATAGCSGPAADCAVGSDGKQIGCWTVTVNDETSLDIDVQLCPVIANSGTLTRCIKFCLFANCIEDPVCFSDDVTFGGLYNFVGKSRGKVKVPGDRQWGCITAQDQLHTLRSCYTFGAGDCSGGQLHARFAGDHAWGGDCLLGGNLDGWKKDDPSAAPSLDVIDILDYGTFVSQFGTPCGDPDTPCGTDGPNADINGDGCVTMADYNSIINNFLVSAKDCCCGPQAAEGLGALTEVSVEELRQMGQEDLIVADLNHDGVLNAEDMDAFMQGVRPTKTHERKGGKGLRSGR